MNATRKIFIYGLLLLASNVCAILMAKYHEKNIVHKNLNDQAYAISSVIQSNLAENSQALGRMANRWQSQNKTPEDLWRADAKAYAHDIIGAFGVGYANKDSQILWLEPAESNKQAIGFYLNSEANRKQALETSLITKRPAITKSITLKQSGLGFLHLHPVFLQNGSHDGFVYLASRFDEYFNKLITSKELCFKVFENNNAIFNNCETAQASKFHFINEATGSSTLTGLVNWKIEVVPTIELHDHLKGLFFQLLLQ